MNFPIFDPESDDPNRIVLGSEDLAARIGETDSAAALAALTRRGPEPVQEDSEDESDAASEPEDATEDEVDDEEEDGTKDESDEAAEDAPDQEDDGGEDEDEEGNADDAEDVADDAGEDEDDDAGEEEDGDAGEDDEDDAPETEGEEGTDEADDADGGDGAGPPDQSGPPDDVGLPDFEAPGRARAIEARKDLKLDRDTDDGELTGDLDLDLRGNARDNVLRGNSGDNVLFGAGGVDELTGGFGADVFAFAAIGRGQSGNIKDFDHEDKIALDDQFFSIGDESIDVREVAPGQLKRAVDLGLISYDKESGEVHVPGQEDPLLTVEGGGRIEFHDVLIF